MDGDVLSYRRKKPMIKRVQTKRDSDDDVVGKKIYSR